MGEEAAGYPTLAQPKAADVEAFRARDRERKRDEFIASIPEVEVLQLASSYHEDEALFFRD